MIASALLAAALQAAPQVCAAPSGSTATIHIAAFRRTHFTLEMPIVHPFERLLREGGTDFALLEVENLVSHFNADEYMAQLPAKYRLDEYGSPEPGAEPVVTETDILETSGGFFLLLPDEGELLDRFHRLARDRASYPEGRVPRTRRRRAELTRSDLPDGSMITSLRIRDPRALRYPQWRSTVALVYKLRYRERDVRAVFLYKTLGGEGRLASALENLRERHGDNLFIVNRGEIFVTGPTKTTGTLAGFRFEGMGLRAAVAGSGELARMPDLLGYRRDSPDGVRFLSANLVYSTAPAKTVLPAYEIFEVAGRRIAVFGLTRRNWKKFLRPEDAKVLTLRDPIATARELVPKLRARADIVIALGNLWTGKNASLRRQVHGIDLIVGDSLQFETDNELSSLRIEDPERGPQDMALLVSGDWPTVLTHLELEHTALENGHYSLSLRQEHIVLDESLPDREGYPKFDPSGYGVRVDTNPPVLPSARRLYEGRGGAGVSVNIAPRHFWSLTASLAADDAGAEAAFVPITGLLQRTTGDYGENLLREWFLWRPRLVSFELPGAGLRALVAEVRRQARPGASLPPGGLRITVGGVGAGDKIHGVPIDSKSTYRVAATENLLARTDQFPAFAKAKNVRPAGELEEIVLTRLRRGAEEGWPAERYAGLLDGYPVRGTGLWKVHFRDVSLNVSNTKVVADPAFSSVSNARVRGFDELLIGGVTKIDVEYYRGPYKWANALEAEYSQSRLRPPDREPILNTPKNRLSFRTGGTLRAGSFPWGWLGKSIGPSMSVEYEGHVERLPLQRRKHIVALLPGVELFSGSFVRSLSLSGNLRRDFTPLVPLNNYGMRARGVFSRSVSRCRLSGEFWSNYFIRTRQDTAQDLRLELDVNLKLHIPIFKHFTVAPFIDYYYFILKVRPISGYSAITGISLNFSRLWKPQYEKFW